MFGMQNESLHFYRKYKKNLNNLVTFLQFFKDNLKVGKI